MRWKGLPCRGQLLREGEGGLLLAVVEGHAGRLLLAVGGHGDGLEGYLGGVQSDCAGRLGDSDVDGLNAGEGCGFQIGRQGERVMLR
jgi:hypothetical protein